MADKLGSVTNERVKQATGKSWDEWVEAIDNFGGESMTHKQIAAKLLEDNYLDSGWWAQSVTVGYEFAKGRRVQGETKDAGFQIGVQRMIEQPQDKIWQLLISPAGTKLWLGDVRNLKFQKGETFKTKEGLSGEIRSVTKDEKLRLTWHPEERSQATTLQIYLLCNRNTPNKTNLRFHHEKLADAEERQAMKLHWQEVLNKIEQLSNNR